ncbi:hypothetical protein [Sphingomonas mesophila]|uniref:hypothetical protein n=1 Tax=Sphingomonas mesophila TaxID=2303576 RepID=UPI0013C2D5D6|nr:hypothetical protein [Sphingomonas mesophila]
MTLPMSRAAAALLRALRARSGATEDRIILISFRSTDWNSLTFSGERHVIELRVGGPEAKIVTERLTAGLSDAEFAIPGQIVADIALTRGPTAAADGSLALTIEALTVAD